MSTIEQERVALVTGASRGIGAAAAIALAQRGFHVVLGVRDAQGAADCVERIQAQGGSAWAIRMDVRDSRSVQAAIAACLDRSGRLDALVNNAGSIEPIGRLGDTDEQSWMANHDVNVGGPYRAIHAALPALLHSPAAAIVNLSSGAAHATREGWSAYCSAKAALAMLTRCVAAEYPSIASFGFQPGLVDTSMQARIRASGINDISRLPRSALVHADQPASCIAWLCDTRPLDLTGQDLSINDTLLQDRMRAAPGKPAGQPAVGA